jgi:hypothetical protein
MIRKRRTMIRKRRTMIRKRRPMIRPINPPRHPWLHRIACLYRPWLHRIACLYGPYNRSVHHSFTRCALPLSACKLCNEACAFYLGQLTAKGKPDTPENYMQHFATVFFVQRDRAAAEAGTPVAHSILTCDLPTDECALCLDEQRTGTKVAVWAYLKAEGRRLDNFEDWYYQVFLPKHEGREASEAKRDVAGAVRDSWRYQLAHRSSKKQVLLTVEDA